MPIRLQKGGAYTSDIRKLRNQIRANGTNANIVAIPVTHPGVAGTNLSVYINLAYQPNGHLAPANASLYVVGFGNANGVWFFAGLGALALPAGAPLPGGQQGDYGALACPHALPNISDQQLRDAVQTMDAYNGGAMTNVIRHAMALLIVAVSEAARLGGIERKINSVLGNYTVLAADAEAWQLVHNWGGHRLGD
ncbi:ribosome-inactivating family protein [Insolitispirillum peregrinum]|uniref:ribosome-inactivating family protein n=1 Tax=Insolitispirillum peregrinum TaxID=80876 RepID=UPI0036184F11